MIICFFHNYYQQPGGEDSVFVAEKVLLESVGHRVVSYTRHNYEIDAYRPLQMLALAKQTLWATDTCRELVTLLGRTEPNVAHFHNTFPLISPSAYYACKKTRVPVVQTLHNYRILCPTATFFRDGQVCEDCLGKTLSWPGVVHACYRASRAQTAVVVLMLAVHRWLKTWSEQVDIYIALTEFAQKKFIEGGLPANKLVVKPNFIHPDPGMREGDGRYALFVGRLSPEKGVQTLLRAWRHLKGIPLKIVGDGPLMGEVRAFMQTQKPECVEVLGRRMRREVLVLMKGARFLVFPSEWYEGFPVTIGEAFACGVPVIASRLGAMAEVVKDEQTGLHFAPGDPGDLAEKVDWAWRHPREMAEMGREARREYEEKYTAERNYEMLMEIYQMAIDKAGNGR